MVNCYIAPYAQAKTWGHEERRRRKMLASKRQLSRMWNATQRQGMTLVPIVMYFNDKGLVKLKLGIAKGKKLADKRETSAERDWNRQKQRLLKQNLPGGGPRQAARCPGAILGPRCHGWLGLPDGCLGACGFGSRRMPIAGIAFNKDAKAAWP